MNTVKTPLEKKVEDYFVARIEALGGIAEKTASSSGRGYFDRVAVLPGGRIIFAEIKRPRRSKVAAHQMLRQEIYQALGAEAVLIKSFADVDRLLALALDGA